MSRNRGWVAVLALSVSGCAVGPDYTPPKTDLKPFHNAVAGTPQKAGQAEPSMDRWWTGFDDPVLTALEARSLEQNLDLAAVLARVRQARAAASGAGAALLPSIDLDGSSHYEHQSLRSPFGAVASTVPGFTRDGHEDAIGPSASWEIDLFGGLRRGAAAARDAAQAAEADRAGIRVMVVADTADTYLQIRGYQARVAVAQAQIVADEQLLELVRHRLAAGAATQREIAQTEALLGQARASVPVLRQGLEEQLNRLDVLTGSQPGTQAQALAVPGEIPEIPPIPANPQPVDMLRRRPDIIAAERRLAATNEQIGAAIGEYYPKLSLSGALGFDSTSASHLFGASAFQALGGGALRWRLFDFGKVDAEVAEARGANAEALAVYRKAVLHAAEDVENALSGLTQNHARLIELRTEVRSLIEARDLARQAYRAGAITLTDVLDADR
ncbi:efflux transporter outer membrane subunit, partial [Burkholderia sp. 3C]